MCASGMVRVAAAFALPLQLVDAEHVECSETDVVAPDEAAPRRSARDVRRSGPCAAVG